MLQAVPDNNNLKKFLYFKIPVFTNYKGVSAKYLIRLNTVRDPLFNQTLEIFLLRVHRTKSTTVSLFYICCE